MSLTASAEVMSPLIWTTYTALDSNGALPDLPHPLDRRHFLQINRDYLPIRLKAQGSGHKASVGPVEVSDRMSDSTPRTAAGREPDSN